MNTKTLNDLIVEREVIKTAIKRMQYSINLATSIHLKVRCDKSSEYVSLEAVGFDHLDDIKSFIRQKLRDALNANKKVLLEAVETLGREVEREK